MISSQNPVLGYVARARGGHARKESVKKQIFLKTGDASNIMIISGWMSFVMKETKNESCMAIIGNCRQGTIL
jgi:hypothetical protein